MSTSLAPDITTVIKFNDLVAQIIGTAFVPHFISTARTLSPLLSSSLIDLKPTENSRSRDL
jgi:hypothetical protein